MLDLSAYLSEIKINQPRLGVALQDLQDAINSNSLKTGVDSTGTVPPPEAPQAINVAASGGVAHVTLTDTSARSSPLHYFIEHDTNPSFPAPHVVDLGPGREAFLPLPAQDNNGNAQLWYFRGYSSYPGSSKPSAKVAFGGDPTGVNVGGYAAFTPLPSPGAGTASATGQQGGYGFGPSLYSVKAQGKFEAAPSAPIPPAPPIGGVTLDMPAEFVVSYPSVAVIDVVWATETANRFLAGPSSGPAAVPGFRAIVGADLPIVPLNKGGTNADLSATGGTSEVLRQSSSGAAITVSQLAASDLSNGTTGSGAVVLAASPTVTGILTVSSTGHPEVAVTGSNSGAQVDVSFQGKNSDASAIGFDIGFGITADHRYEIRDTVNSHTVWQYNDSTGAFQFNVLGVGTLNVDSTGVNCNTGIFKIGGVSGITAGSFTAITAITSTGGIVTQLTGTSDERLKDYDSYEGGLAEILAIRPVRYHWNEAGQKHTGLSGEQEFVGFTAQDVQRAIPEAITATESDEKYLSLDDRPILAACVNAIKQLSARLERLEERR